MELHWIHLKGVKRAGGDEKPPLRASVMAEQVVGVFELPQVWADDKPTSEIRLSDGTRMHVVGSYDDIDAIVKVIANGNLQKQTIELLTFLPRASW